MAITSTGYDGSIDETQWARLLPQAGSSHYGVTEADDWKVTPHPTTDRAVNIAVGSGWGHGVLDTSDAVATLAGATVPTGSRWDLIVARRDWSGTGGTTTFAIITGSVNKELPARNTTPGTLDDQPLALVQFTSGVSSATAVVDLRCWSRNGGMVVRDQLALTYLFKLGAQVKLGSALWSCLPDVNGAPYWSTSATDEHIPLWGAGNTLAGGVADPSRNFLVQAGTTVQYFDQSGYARIIFPRPFPNGLLFVGGFDGDDWATGGSNSYASAGSIWGAEGFGTRTSWVYAGRSQPASATGSGSLVIGRSSMAGRIHRINWLAIGW